MSRRPRTLPHALRLAALGVGLGVLLYVAWLAFGALG